MGVYPQLEGHWEQGTGSRAVCHSASLLAAVAETSPPEFDPKAEVKGLVQGSKRHMATLLRRGFKPATF